MNYKEEFDQTAIRQIADEFKNGVIVPKGIKTWYEYKQAVTREIEDMTEAISHFGEDAQIFPKLKKAKEEAESELAWIKSIHTYDLQKVCEYIILTTDEYKPTIKGVTHWNFPKMNVHMAKKVINGCSQAEENFIRETFEESDIITVINQVRKLTRNINERNWTYMFNRKTEYNPYETAMDGTKLYDHREHYVYIKSKCTQHRYGETYWISIDCDNELYSLPIIKDFKNYDFEIGTFYKIQCTDEIKFGNKKKYVMDIQESSEEEFMEKGFKNYAIR